jgi:hypothetical protein
VQLVGGALVGREEQLQRGLEGAATQFGLGGGQRADRARGRVRGQLRRAPQELGRGRDTTATLGPSARSA